jgi:hypothetical protein
MSVIKRHKSNNPNHDLKPTSAVDHTLTMNFAMINNARARDGGEFSPNRDGFAYISRAISTVSKIHET